MARVEIYTKVTCGFCRRAKMLLDMKKVPYEEIAVDFGGPDKARMVERANGRMTVPQIFIDGVHVGGCDDLMALEQEGKLDTMLAA
ncbi:glutaredoxin 3 [Sphingomonas rhizophila]|uniref:Glutaredoxin n=1 Tax=Sphingomonas rhizophila TaxID=2071607 RepID=A0A7G9SCD3_9SPHN|nr:glutaredoxin 3 [Sphingomonas rhizophila]QNN65508.1 glutaredoxin 3 [Sphingomonas rhizophila]